MTQSISAPNPQSKQTPNLARRAFGNGLAAAAIALPLATLGGVASAATAEDLQKDSAQALSILYKSNAVANNLSKSTIKDDAYAFLFDQQGLMASVSIEGTKITPIAR